MPGQTETEARHASDAQHGQAAGRAAMSQRRLGHIVLLTTGTAPPSRNVEGPSGPATQGYTTLVHMGENGSSRSLLVCGDLASMGGSPLAGPAQAVAVPDSLLPPRPQVDRSMDLAETPLVRASRALVRVLLTTLPWGHSDSPSEAATEDAVVGVVRGVLREQGPSLLRRNAPDEVDRRVWETIATCHTDPAFDVDAIAKELAFSRRQLYRRFSGAEGIAGLIARYRLSTAKKLIDDYPDMPLSDVAGFAGFSRLANMRALFIVHVGMTPTAYRREGAAVRP